MNLLYIIKVSSYIAFPNHRGSFFASLVGKSLGKRGLSHLGCQKSAVQINHI